MAGQNKSHSNSNNKQGKAGNKVPQSWLETLKANGEVPNQAEKTEKLKARQEKELFHINRVKKQEKEIYSRRQRETQEKIKELQQQVKALAEKSENLKEELRVAVQQPVVNPGESDISFLTSLIKAIKRFGEKIEDASLWLKAWNQKKQKKGMFWSKVNSKKGGTQFLLSSEHSASRSAG